METAHSRTLSMMMLNEQTVELLYADNKSIELRDTITDYNLYDRYTKGKRLKRLISLGHFSAFTLRARVFFNEETMKRKDLIIADAIVAEGFLQRLAAAAYMMSLGKFFPVKIFRNEETAKSWLETLGETAKFKTGKLAF